MYYYHQLLHITFKAHIEIKNYYFLFYKFLMTIKYSDIFLILFTIFENK